MSETLPSDCPEGLVCYTEEDHSKIEKALLALKKTERWANLAWIACKPVGEGEKQ